MAYGLDRLFRDDFAVARPTDRYRAWRGLDERSRLRLVERRLKAANDLIDGYPLAL